ncbi:hypothetical protein V6U90_25040 [Micromonospora sp. CPCC 206060]|uniref:hypothetical protein n=1 Tax=Micromonospora sp. CPCC 206060 TaxID=3122406 RepID=UPI002FF2A568
MSIEEVKTNLGLGSRALDEARTTIQRAGMELADATALALSALQGTSHPDAEKARAVLASAAKEVELTARRVNVAKEHAERYLKALG